MRREQALRIMGFAVNSKPTKSEINKSYRRLVLKVHPDKLVISEGTPEKKIKLIRREQNEKFVALKEARDFLLNPTANTDIRAQFWAAFLAELRKRQDAAKAEKLARKRFMQYSVDGKEPLKFEGDVGFVWRKIDPTYDSTLKRLYIEDTNLTASELYLFIVDFYKKLPSSFEKLTINKNLLEKMSAADKASVASLAYNHFINFEIKKVHRLERKRGFVKQGFLLSIALMLVALAATSILFPSTLISMFTLSSLDISINITKAGILMVFPLFSMMDSRHRPPKWIENFILGLAMLGVPLVFVSFIQSMTGISYALICSATFIAITTNLSFLFHPQQFRAEAALRYFDKRGKKDKRTNFQNEADEVYCLGLEAKNWGAYLNSFKPSSLAWQYSDAFSAGLFASTENNSKLPMSIEKLKKPGKKL